MKRLSMLAAAAALTLTTMTAHAMVDPTEIREAVSSSSYSGSNLRATANGDVVTLAGYGDALSVALTKRALMDVDGVSEVRNLATTRN